MTTDPMLRLRKTYWSCAIFSGFTALVGCDLDLNLDELLKLDGANYVLNKLKDCDELNEFALSETDTMTKERVEAQVTRCLERAQTAQSQLHGGFLTDIDHCLEIRRMVDTTDDPAAQERVRAAWRACVGSNTDEYQGDAHCDELRESAARAEAAGDAVLFRRYQSAFYDCKAKDGSRDQRYDHCLEMRALAARAEEGSEDQRRLINAYLACVDNVKDEGRDAQHCDDLRALAERARQAGDEERFRHYSNAYYNCVDADGGGVTCGDGSQLTCRQAEPTCEAGRVTVVVEGCWTCVPREQCGGMTEDPCIQFRHEASARQQAGDDEGYRRLITAYIECTGSTGGDTGETLTCRNTRCPQGYYCSESRNGPMCTAADADVTCPREWVPVCGRDNVTYSSACVARSLDVGILHEGECRQHQEPTPNACPTLYAPVCGRDLRTYGNECEAASRGVTVLYEGVCERESTGGEPTTEACPREYIPVCGRDGVTYTNDCYARQAGVTVVSTGECPPREDTTTTTPPATR